MPIDRAVVAQTEFFKNHARHEQTLDAFFHLVGELHTGFSKNRLDEIARLIVQMRVSGIRHDAVQVISDRAHVFCDRPLVVVEHDDETLGMRFDIVERFVTDSTGERGIARDYDNVFIAAAQIASDSHAESSGKRGAGMTRDVAIVFAFGAQKKAIQTAELPHRGKAIEPPGKHLMDIALVTDVHDKAVARRVEHTMERNGQLDHAEIRSQMSSGLRKNFDQLIAHFLRELGQVLFA